MIWHRPPTETHVYINETVDHGADDEIRFLIFKLQMSTGIQHAVFVSSGQDDIEVETAAMWSQLKVGSKTSEHGVLYVYRPRTRELKIKLSPLLAMQISNSTGNKLSEQQATEWVESSARGSYSESNYDFWRHVLESTTALLLNPHLIEIDPVARQNALSSDKFRAQGFVDKSLETYVRSLQSGVVVSDLDILTEESRRYRKLNHPIELHLRQAAIDQKEAGIDRVFQSDGFAFVFFKPSAAVLPIIFKNENGLWRVQEPLALSLFEKHEVAKKTVMKFPLKGRSNEFNDYIEKRFRRPVYPIGAAIELKNLSASPDLKDLRSLFFQLRDTREIGSKFDVKDASLLPAIDRWILADTQLDIGHWRQFLETYRLATDLLPDDKQIRETLRDFEKLPVLSESSWKLKRN